jgi:hypothetical protein
VDELTQRLNTLSSQLESALALSSTLQAQHTAAISALESKVLALKSLLQSSQPQPPLSPVVEAVPPPSETLTQMLNEWKKSVEGQWSSVREEWASERERLASAREEWEAKAKVVESSLGSATTKVDAGLVSLALLQHQNGLGNGNVKVFHGTSSGLVTPQVHEASALIRTDLDNARRDQTQVEVEVVHNHARSMAVPRASAVSYLLMRQCPHDRIHLAYPTTVRFLCEIWYPQDIPNTFMMLSHVNLL